VRYQTAPHPDARISALFRQKGQLESGKNKKYGEKGPRRERYNRRWSTDN
jgi:hypothetical protein